jgi:hypothetical protein
MSNAQNGTAPQNGTALQNGAADPQERLRALIALTERLTTLLAEQAQAFEAHRPQDAAASMEEVGRLSGLYRQESQKTRAEAQPFAGAPLALRAQLVRATEAFDAVLARHGRALHAAKTVTEGLVRAIAEEVAAQRSMGAGYGPGAAKSLYGAATAVTLNKRA